jgi:hypothetical protein
VIRERADRVAWDAQQQGYSAGSAEAGVTVLRRLADKLEAGPEPDGIITDDAVHAFGDVLHKYGYDVATYTRVSPTEVRYEQAGATPAFETVRGALVDALGSIARERDEALSSLEWAMRWVPEPVTEHNLYITNYRRAKELADHV